MPNVFDPVTNQIVWKEDGAGVGGGNSEANSLVSVPAEANIAAAPQLEQLSGLVNKINQQAQQQANLSRIPGAAGLEQQSSENIANLLAGNLPTGFTEQLRSSLAGKYGGAGFGVDTAALNAAALRASGIESQEQQLRGEQALAGAYARNPAAPIWDVTRGMLTPENYTNYLNQKAQQAAEAARLAENRRQFDLDYKLRVDDNQYRLQIAQMQAAQAQAELDEKIREFNRTQDQRTLEQVNELKQRAAMANQDVALKTQQLNAQVWNTALQYMDPRWANFEALTQRSLPNYVQTTQIPTVTTNYRTLPNLGGY